uniref:DM10 domain-containing protein n=1 Tax=Clastoptera arizonana TaxID=38151 RepID=A0A1B6DLI7_9HEMI
MTKKCLTFHAFFKQSVVESPNEHYRVRHVNILYFLEDDTITVMEPPVKNAGFPQGRLVRRDKIPRDTSGVTYHWKDFNVGIDIMIYGITYHISSCDEYTKEFLLSQGVELNDMEDMPQDPYTQSRMNLNPHVRKTPPVDDKLRRFLEFDGKVLRFYAVWDDRDSEHGELRPYIIHYYLADDCVDVKEVKTVNSGHDSFPKLLNKMKLPKDWKNVPDDYPSIFMEKGDPEVTEYYQPKDFVIGNTIFILGRRFLLYNCDDFTRRYFKHCLNIEQPGEMKVFEEKKPSIPPPLPPHIAFGTPEDTVQSCYTFMLKPPKKDVLRYITNAGKKLRYTASMDWVHPEDEHRRFMIEYFLADGQTLIQEVKIPNSGFIAGRFLKPMLLPKPQTNPDNPEFYTPSDFLIGSIIDVFGHRFKITGADLKVYRYMEANPEKFTEEAIENMRKYMVYEGLLTEEIKNIANFDIRHDGCENQDCEKQ